MTLTQLEEKTDTAFFLISSFNYL